MSNSPANSQQFSEIPSLFTFKDHQVRVVERDGEPWFILRDILLALGLYLGPRSGTPNVTAAMRGLDLSDVQLTPIQLNTVDGRQTTRRVALVSESGLYRFIMRSDKPNAKPFQDWVTREVLPSIRKDGGYILGQENMTPEQFIRALVKFAGRKVRTQSHDGMLWSALPDLARPLYRDDDSPVQRDNRRLRLRQFLENNAPPNPSRIALSRQGRRTVLTSFVSPEAIPAVLTYVTGKINGVDFRAAWSKLPQAEQLAA